MKFEHWTETVEEFFEDMTDSFRSDWDLDAESCPEDWQTMSEDSWRRGKHMDQITPLMIQFGSTLTGADRDLLTTEIESLEGEEIALTLPVNPFVRLVEDDEDSGPYQWRSISALDFLRQNIAVRLAEKEAPRFAMMAERIIELQQFVVRPRSELARAYLSRVAQCYMRGLEAEGVVRCRSVLEAELDAYLDLDDVVGKGYAPSSSNVTLCAKLDYLRDESDLPHDVWRAANEVRRAGNAELHIAPGIEDLRTVLQHLTTVLDALAE